MENAKELARRYLPNAVELLAAVAFGDDNPASLHSRVIAAKEIITVAEILPQGISMFSHLSRRDSDNSRDAADA
jgi:hypothetical protein